MEILDIILLIILVGSLVFGWRKGILKQVGSIAGLIVGVLACRIFGPVCAGWFYTEGAGSHSHLLETVLVYFVLFILVYIGVSILAKTIKLVVHRAGLGFLDRFAGAVFTLALWLFLFSLLLNLWCAIFKETKIKNENKPYIAFVMRLAPEVLASDNNFNLNLDHSDSVKKNDNK